MWLIYSLENLCVCVWCVAVHFIYIKFVLPSLLVPGFTFWESLSCWQESIKAWPIPRVTGSIAARVLECQVRDGSETRVWSVRCSGQAYSPGHSTGTWRQPREASTLAGTERPGVSQHGWLQWIWRGALNLKGNEEKSLMTHWDTKLRKISRLLPFFPELTSPPAHLSFTSYGTDRTEKSESH